MLSLIADFESSYNGCVVDCPTLEELLAQCSADGSHGSGDEDAAENEYDHGDYKDGCRFNL